jgi:hypothetical protein
MRAVSVILGASAVSLVAATGIAARVHADDTSGIALNGNYLVTSNGEWSKTNEVFHNEQVVRQVWTTTSTCESPTSCTGHLTSSLGWAADMVYTEDRWVVRRTIPDWEPCYDGSVSPGRQEFRFWPVDSNGQRYPSDGSLFGGFDETYGVSGGCGRNLPLVIKMPVRLQRIIQ